MNISGLLLNSLGICWYAYERYVDERRRNNVRRGVTKLGQMNHVSDSFITRNESQLTLSPKVVRHDNDAVGPSAGSLERRNQDGGRRRGWGAKRRALRGGRRRREERGRIAVSVKADGLDWIAFILQRVNVACKFKS